MAYENEAVNASGGDGLFPQHPRSGDWETLEGKMLAPHIQAPLESTNSGDPRFNGEVNSHNWEANIVTGGEFDPNKMTGPGGTLAK